MRQTGVGFFGASLVGLAAASVLAKSTLLGLKGAEHTAALRKIPTNIPQQQIFVGLDGRKCETAEQALCNL